jgi:hypothetical protein
VRYARNIWATGSLNVLNPISAFARRKPTAQGCGKFTEIPRFAYKFVNLGTGITVKITLSPSYVNRVMADALPLVS